MKYLIACFMLLVSSVAFADTLQISKPTLTTTITGIYLSTVNTQYGPLIEFNATSITYTQTKQAVSRQGFVKPSPSIGQYDNWSWEGRFPGNRTYDGSGLCYQEKGSTVHDIKLSCITADTYIEEPTCGTPIPCP